MKTVQCRYEEAVSRAVLLKQWDTELQTHVASCSICQNIIDITRWLEMLAKTSEPEPALPGAHYVWWRVQLLRRQAIREQVTRPIIIAQTITYFGLSLGLGLGIVWLWPQIESGLLKFSSRLLLGWSFFVAESNLLTLLYLGIGLFCINAILTLRIILAESKLKK